MYGRDRRIHTFEDTAALCESNETLRRAIAESRADQRIYWEGDPIPYGAPRFQQAADMVLSLKKTVEAARPYAEAGKRVCILNFASSVSPGGGVVTGCQAQEESICRVSTLYFALSDPETAGEFYDLHWELIRSGKMNRRNRDDILYTPGVVAVREDAADERLLKEPDWYKMDVITCAAPDLRQSFDGSMYCPSREELDSVLENRWKCILSAAARHQADVLILGAFGCGVFDNPPDRVAAAFNRAFSPFHNYFETVEFAVYCSGRHSRNYQAFTAVKGIREA